jgi:predicted aldo/keto reductase-like oxidoreductase
MGEYGRYRYKIFGDNSHWLPGAFASKNNIDKIDISKVPENIPLKKMLTEAHSEFYVPKYKVAFEKVKRKIMS